MMVTKQRGFSMRRKAIALIMAMAMTTGLLAGCGSSSGGSADSTSATDSSTATESTTASDDSSIQVEFWSAPNENQFEYWTAKADAYNSEGHEVDGKTVTVNVSMIPETTSSEAAIQNALATDSAPAVSENINNSFMVTLADSNCVYDIQDEEWYQQILTNKALDDGVTSTWEYNGKQYVIPVYINPICLIWNQKALDTLGCDIPTTMDEFKDVIQKFVDNKDAMADIGVEFTTVGSYFANSSDYWNRNYDFFMIYDALGGGELYDGNTLAIDADIAADAFEFWGMLGNTMCIDEIADAWSTSGDYISLFGFGYPWELSSYTESGKIYGVDYTFGPTIVKNEGDKPAYYSDSKGIIFYKDANITDEIHDGAVDFISWVYSEDNCAQTDADWLSATTMLPVRGDISSNEVFTSALDETPALSFLADSISNAVAGPTHSKSSDMYTALGENGFVPYIQEAVTHDAFDTLDASSYVEAGLEAVISAGGLDQ